MPIYNIRQLRQRLGQEYLHDTIISTSTGSWGLTANPTFWDEKLADPTLSGERIYDRAWMRIIPISVTGTYWDSKVASFNTQSGAFQLTGTPTSVLGSGSQYEIHKRMSPVEKDLFLHAVIKGMKFTQEVAIGSVKDAHTYSLGSEFIDITDARYFSDPTHSLNRTIGWFRNIEYVKTATGQELRINPSITESYQLLLTAVLSASTTLGDTGTVNIPSDDWALAGAAVRCYWALEQESPSQEASLYQSHRKQMVRQYNSLSKRFQPIKYRKINLEGNY